MTTEHPALGLICESIRLTDTPMVDTIRVAWDLKMDECPLDRQLRIEREKLIEREMAKLRQQPWDFGKPEPWHLA